MPRTQRVGPSHNISPPKKAPQNLHFEEILMMSLLTTTANAVAHTPGKQQDEEASNDHTPTQDSLMSKTSNQDMETNGLEELGKHLDIFINDKANKKDPENKEISFSGNHTFF